MVKKKHQDLTIIDTYWKPTPPGFKGIIIKIIRKALNYWNKFHKKSYIFQHCGPYDPPQIPNCHYEKFTTIEEIPQSVINTILHHDGERVFTNDKFEIENKAIMWICFYKGNVAHIKFSRYGKHFKKWFVNLKDKDIVLFRGRTHKEYRGLGLQGATSKYIMNSLLEIGQKAYCDCSIHNNSSARGISKAGFKIIATKKPISRKTALGIDQ